MLVRDIIELIDPEFYGAQKLLETSQALALLGDIWLKPTVAILKSSPFDGSQRNSDSSTSLSTSTDSLKSPKKEKKDRDTKSSRSPKAGRGLSVSNSDLLVRSYSTTCSKNRESMQPSDMHTFSATPEPYKALPSVVVILLILCAQSKQKSKSKKTKRKRSVLPDRGVTELNLRYWSLKWPLQVKSLNKTFPLLLPQIGRNHPNPVLELDIGLKRFTTRSRNNLPRPHETRQPGKDQGKIQRLREKI